MAKANATKAPKGAEAPKVEAPSAPVEAPKAEAQKAPKLDIAVEAAKIVAATAALPIILGDDEEPTTETLTIFGEAVSPIVRAIPERFRGALVATVLPKVTGTLRKGTVGQALAAVPTGADPGALVREYVATETERFASLMVAAVHAGHVPPSETFWADMLAAVTPETFTAATERLTKIAAGRSTGDGTRETREKWTFAAERPYTLTHAFEDGTQAECETVPGSTKIVVTKCPGIVAGREADDPTGKTFALSAGGSAIRWARGAERPASGVIACRGPEWWAGFSAAIVAAVEAPSAPETVEAPSAPVEAPSA